MRTAVAVNSRATTSPTARRWLVKLIDEQVAPESTPTVTATSVRMSWVYEHSEAEIANRLGGWPIRLPYSDIVATGPGETDVDHIVPIEEALQSGAEGWGHDRWRDFQSDLLNLMLANPQVNRHRKGAKGIGEWCPPYHRLWYAWDYSLVKLAYGLTFDRHEADVLKRILTPVE